MMRMEGNRIEVQWIPVSDAADMLEVSRQRVHQLIKLGHLTARKTGFVWLVSVQSIRQRQALLEKDGG